jgi:biotin synthase
MRTTSFDATVHERLSDLGQRVLNGGRIEREEALWLFQLEDTADIFELMAWANRIRERYKGNKIHLCSIVNAKAGACSENCSFCAQSAHYQTSSPKYGFVDPEPVQNALTEAQQNQVTAVGLVAAWRGLNEGPMLDEVCDRISEMKASGKSRPDASLGLIKTQKVADRLKAAGLECYGHNLESSRRFFPQTCSTHTFDDRLETSATSRKPASRFAPAASSAWARRARTVATSRCPCARLARTSAPSTSSTPSPARPSRSSRRCRRWKSSRPSPASASSCPDRKS